MQFVIWNVDQKKYVARPGSEHSFTKYLQKAESFRDQRTAQNNCCGNEFPVSVQQAMATG